MKQRHSHIKFEVGVGMTQIGRMIQAKRQRYRHSICKMHEPHHRRDCG